MKYAVQKIIMCQPTLSVPLPAGTKWLSAGSDNGEIAVWYKKPVGAAAICKTINNLRAIPTGVAMNDISIGDYLGTVVREGLADYHVFVTTE